MESEMTSIGVDDKQLLSDMELGPRPKVTPVISRLRIELKKPVVKAVVPEAPSSPKAPSPRSKAEPLTAMHAAKEPEGGVTGLVLESNDMASEKSAPAGTNSVSAKATVVLGSLVSEEKPKNSEAVEGPGSKVESVAVAHPAVVKDEGEGKLPVVEDGEGGILPKMSEPPSHKEAEGVAVESEVSKGKKRKKRAGLLTADGAMDNMGNRSRKVDRFCYMCGSPEHIARDCVNSVGPYPAHPGIYGAGVPLPPAGMPPYGPDVYWHGPPLQHAGRPFPINYAEGMFGPGPGMMPFDRPRMPAGPYGVPPPYMPPLYPGGPRHESFLGAGGPGLIHPMDRPLSREEFIELQERRRLQRLMQDRHERAWSPERLGVSDGRGQFLPDSPHRTHHPPDRRTVVEDRRTKDTGLYLDKFDHLRSKASKQERKHVVERLVNRGEAHHSTSDDDYASPDDVQDLGPKQHEARKTVPAEVKQGSKWSKQDNVGNLSPDFDDENEDRAHSVRRHDRKSRDAEAPLKHSKQWHSKHTDDARTGQTGLAGDGDGQSSKHKGRRMGQEDPKPGSFRQEYEEVVGKEDVRGVTSGRWTGSDSDEDAVRSGRRKHRSHSSKAKAVVEVHEHESRDDERKKKRKHKKRNGNSLDQRRDKDKVDVEDSGEIAGKRRRLKSSGGSHAVPSSTEHPRWDLDYQQGDRGRKSSQSDHSRHRHQRQRNGRSRHS